MGWIRDLLAAMATPMTPERLLMISNDHGLNGKKQPYWIRGYSIPKLFVEPLRHHIDTDEHRQIGDPHVGEGQL